MNRIHSALLVAAVASTSSIAGATTVTNYLTGTTSTTWASVIGFNPRLAGRDLNGVGLNGRLLDGRLVVGVSYEGASAPGGKITDAWIDGGELRGRDARGRQLKRASLVGTSWEASVDDGTTVELAITAAERHPEHVNRDVWGYEVWYPSADTWEPLCGLDDDGLPVLAIALEGRWSYEEGVPGGGDWIDDPSSFTFACEQYVLAKCVTAGYHPWDEMHVCSKGQGCGRTSLAPLHQACTRALRADYCGDGSSHTVDGTVVNLFDAVGIRSDTESWPLEATWSSEGARCLREPRIDDAEISCATELQAADCEPADAVAAMHSLATETM